MTTNTFTEWLQNELDIRGWTPADLARESKNKISPSQITRLFNGERGIGEKGINAIATALNLPVDFVMEKAKKIPPKPDLSPAKRKLMHVAEAEELADSDVELAIMLLEQRIEFYKKNPKARTAE